MSARKAGSAYVGKVANATEILSVTRERLRTYTQPTSNAEPREFRTDEKAAVIIQKMVQF
jgi:hypothetical protein